MSLYYKARCDNCGEVYSQHEIVRTIWEEKTYKTLLGKEKTRRYPDRTELIDCPNCEHHTYVIIVSTKQ